MFLPITMDDSRKRFARDTDNNLYSVVQVGTQFWLGENLRVGQVITDAATFPDASGPIVGWAPNGDAANVATMGLFYHWDMAMRGSTTEGAQGICPDGFHIPTDEKQHTLDAYYATGSCAADRSDWGCNPAGTALKPGGVSGLHIPLAGYRDSSGVFLYFDTYVVLWSSTESGISAWRRYLTLSNSAVHRAAIPKTRGYSVRCVRDAR